MKLILNELKKSLEIDDRFSTHKEALEQIIFFLNKHLKITKHPKRVSKRLNPLLQKLSSDIENIPRTIEHIENIIISIISVDLLTIPAYLQYIIAESRFQASSNTIIPILSKFIENTFAYEFGQETLPVSYEIFANWIFKFLLHIGINSNLFAHSLIKKYLCGGQHLTFDDCTPMPRCISQFFEYFLIKENFRFIARASIISSKIRELTLAASFGIAFTVSSTKSNLPEAKEFLDCGTRFKFTNLCLDNLNIHKYRDDQMILIGSHQLCDIQLPDTDPESESIVSVIFPSYKSWKFSDISKSALPKVSKKIQPSQTEKLMEGMLISFGRLCLIEIMKIIYYEDENGDCSSSLIFSFKKGPYVDILKEFRTRPSDPNPQNFIIGRGGLGKSISLFVPDKYRLGRHHASFQYIRNEWMIEDLGSSAGTFLHIRKSFDKSKPAILIKEKQESVTLNVCGYVFYIEKVLIP